jgi:hypothetical protein
MPSRGVHSSSFGVRSPDHMARRAPPSPKVRRGWLRFDRRGHDRAGRIHEAAGRHGDLLSERNLRPSAHRRHRVSCPVAVRRPADHTAVVTNVTAPHVDLPLRPGLHLMPVADTRRAGGERPATVLRPAPGAAPKKLGLHRRHRSRRLRRLLLVLLIAVGTAVSVATSGTVRHQLLLSFTRRPDNFAELYFPSPGRLPTSFIPGRPLAVTFGLTNDSDGTRQFSYIATAVSSNGHATREVVGTLRVKGSGAVVMPLHISLPPDTTSLSISLVGQPVLIRLLLHEGVAHAG